MIRCTAAVVIVLVIMGGLQFYMTHRPQVSAPTGSIQLQAAPGEFTVEVTLTFAAGPDEFAFDPEDAPCLVVSLNGHEILSRKERVAAGEAILIGNVDGLKVGANEFFLHATPQNDQQLARAARVRILRDDQSISDRTLWAESGDVVSGAIKVDIPAWVKVPSDEKDPT